MASKQQGTKYAGVTFRETGTDKIFYIRYRQGGRETKQIFEPVGKASQGMTAAKANLIRSDRIAGKELPNTIKRAAQQEQRAQEQALLEAEQNRMTLWEIWERYAKAHATRQIMRADKPSMKHLTALYDKEPMEIGKSELDALTERLAHTIGERTGKLLRPQTQKHVLALLRRLLVFAENQELCPVPRLKFNMPVVDNETTEHLSDAEYVRYVEALNTDYDQVGANILRFALVTGMRKGAILALEWNDIDFDRGIITLQGTKAKSGKTKQLPLSADALLILQNVERTKSSYVFPSPRTGGKRQDIRKLAERIKRNANLPADFRPVHGLRHHFASSLASSGKVELHVIQKLLTHTSPEMTQRYAHLRDETLKNALNFAPSLSMESKDDKE